ncbi:uncharacterized protein METZ01_LOCUS251485 [marine metagenome]|uniref:Yip1 domain-containing protein n=1 Tax=marine metagenome TaxID=408172 RepID=A0A382IIX0_9ZZZZ
MIGAAKLDVRIYEEVEGDTNATGQAMGVVLLAALANAIGSGLGGLGPFVVVGIGALIGWAISAFTIYIVGAKLLPESQTRADVGELMRTMGFAQAPGLLRVLGSLPGVSSFVLFCISIWLLVTMVVAVRQALDYSSTPRAVGVCLVAQFLSGLLLLLFVAP